MSITVGIKLDFLVARIGPDQQLPSVPWDQSLVIPPLLRAPSCMPADQHERYVLNCVRDRLPPQSLVLPPPVETGFGAALTQRREPDIQFPHQAWPLFWVVQPAPGLTADMTSDCPYRWTPVKVTSPVLAFAPGMKTDQPLAQAWMQKLTTPLQSVRLGLRTQVSSACRLVVHVGFGDDSDDSSLLALKRLATVLWLGESVLGRLRSAERHTADEEQPLNAVARLAQRAQYDVDDVLAAERADVDAAFVAWMAPVVGPPPAHAEVRDQAAAVRRSLLLMLSSADVVDRAGASRVAGVDASRVLLHELYLLWRAPSRDLLARLLTAHAGPGLPWPADADLQHGEPAWTRNVAYDFANLRAAARVQSRLAHHATLAFRLPMGTLDPALVAAWADLAGALAHRTATCSAADWRDQVLPRLCRPSPDDADLWWLLAWAQVSADTMGTFWRHVRVQGHQSKTDELGLDGVMWQPLE